MSSFFEEGDPAERARVEQVAARRSRRRSRIAVLVLGVLVLLAAAGYVALYRHSVDRVPWGTRVEGVRIGGLSADRAVARLRDRLEPDLHRALTFVHQQDRYQLVPARAGVSIDYAATVREAGGTGSGASPARLWHFAAGGGRVDPVIRVDTKEFDRTLRRLADEIGRPLVEGNLAFGRHRVRPVFGQPGLTVAADSMRRMVESLVFDPATTQLPVTRQQPYVGPAGVRRALRRFGRPAMSGPVTVVIAGQRVVVPPRVFGPLLSMVPSGHHLVPVLDGDRLDAAMRPLMHTLGDKPRNASVRIVHGHPRIRPAVIGVSYDDDQLAAAFLRHLRHTGPARTVHLHAAVQRPARTTAEVRRLGIRQVVGSARVSLADGDAHRARRLDGVLLDPGDSLSVSHLLGSGDRAVATGLLRAARRARLAVDRIAPVSESADSGGHGVSDVTVRAAGRYGVLVDVRVSDGHATFRLWSTRPRGGHQHTQSPPSGTTRSPHPSGHRNARRVRGATAPDRSAPDRSAPDRSVPDRSVQGRWPGQDSAGGTR